MENADNRYQSTETAKGYKRNGKILGAVGIIFNTIGIVFFLAYGANSLNLLFNIVFWMFGMLQYFISFHTFASRIDLALDLTQQYLSIQLNRFSSNMDCVCLLAERRCLRM